MSSFVALLRGINVGGKNVIKMADLKTCFESMGFDNVATYIQSGNVVFDSREKRQAELVANIEKALARAFKYDGCLVVRTRKRLRETIEAAPPGFGDQPKKFRYDVLFLLPNLKAATALPQVPTKPGVDTAHAGPDALYFTRLISKASQSRLSRITSMPIYQHMTIRNWNTTTKLLAMMQ